MNYSDDVLESVIDSMYLRLDHFDKQFSEGKIIPCCAILEFAHSHEMEPLFKKMVNLLILVSNPSDHSSIKHLADY